MKKYKIMWQYQDGTTKDVSDKVLKEKNYLNKELLQSYVDGLNYAYCNYGNARYIVAEVQSEGGTL